MDRYDTDPQELAETSQMLDEIIERPDEWEKPLSDWFRTNITDLLDRTEV